MKIDEIKVGDNLVYTEQMFGTDHNVVVTKKERCASDRFYLWLHLTDKGDKLHMGSDGALLLIWEKEEITNLTINKSTKERKSK